MKNKRQNLIRTIVEEQRVCTQGDLAKLLQERGIVVTQATLSRDIKEMMLMKVADGSGAYRYICPQANHEVIARDRAERTLKGSIVKVLWNVSLAVIHTLPGAANFVAYTLDNLEWDEILGTIAGDDAVFVAVKDGCASQELAKKLENYM